MLFGPIPQDRDAVIHLFEMPPPCFGQGEHPKRQEPDIAPAPRYGAHPPGAYGTSALLGGSLCLCQSTMGRNDRTAGQPLKFGSVGKAL